MAQICFPELVEGLSLLPHSAPEEGHPFDKLREAELSWFESLTDVVEAVYAA